MISGLIDIIGTRPINNVCNMQYVSMYIEGNVDTFLISIHFYKNWSSYLYSSLFATISLT